MTRFSEAILCLSLLLSPPMMRAQNPSDASGLPAAVSVSGTVFSHRTGLPLRRASVVLEPRSSGLPTLSDTTDDKGRYSFPDVTPGAYQLNVSRDGFLSSTAGWIQDYRFPPVFTLRPGANLSGLDFRLYPWNIVSGQITFEDAEPAVNAEVALYRDAWRLGRHVYEIAARTRTDDRGQYRLYGITPGAYFISAAWSHPAPAPGAVEEPRRGEQGQPLPDEAYAVTFYPSAQALLNAQPVHLGYGSEADGIDIILSTTQTVRIRGRVTGGVHGDVIPNPGISLRRVGANDALAVGAAVTVNVSKTGEFELSGVTPGTYELVAEADEEGKHLIGRRTITVDNQGVSNLEILAAPPVQWFGEVHFAGDAGPETENLAGLAVELKPRDDLAPDISAETAKDGSFALEIEPGETYDLYMKNLPEGAYLAAASSGGLDLLAHGASLSAGSTVQGMELVLRRDGAKAVGAVLNEDRTVAPGSTVDLLPDPPAGRYRDFQRTYADEYGNFQLEGIAPGKYIMIGWAGEAPCDVYNPGDLGACRAAGAEVTFDAGATQSVILKLASAQE